MDISELQKKIDHARSLDAALPPLPCSDLPELLRVRKDLERSYLTYIDENDERVELNYAEFCDKVRRVALFLRHRGLGRGDRIATVSHNHWHTVVQYFAAWLMGIVVVPINLGEDDERIAYILEKGEIELAFIRTEYRDRLITIMESNDRLKHIERLICEDTMENYTHAEGSLPSGQDLSEAEALIVFTSGTTGPPKAVVLSQRNLLEDARAIADWHAIVEDTRMMCVLPIHHVNGTVVTLITPFYAGGSTVLNRRFRVGQFFPIIDDEEVHIVSVVPTLLQDLNNYYSDASGNGDRPECRSLSHVICGAGPLTVKVAEQFEE
ncbi:MAG: class I adenylate-forming enzyme family protein, partial [Balneolaceae bacterium]|nr:class I adenylate-forming enzyme family protein [Balneolaceae bacterium]